MSLVDIKTPAESEEGTTMKVQAWLKQPGDLVSKNEPIVEMETDKVTLEIEAPVDGVLSKILVPNDVDIAPDTVIGVIETAQQDALSKPQESEPMLSSEAPQRTGSSEPFIVEVNLALSPSVRRFVMQHDVDVSQVVGTGRRNRITLKDVQDHFNKLGFNSLSTVAELKTASAVKSDSVVSDLATNITRDTQGYSQHIPHSSMRRSIAEHMLSSVSEAPHVTAVFEADFSAIAEHKDKHKQGFAELGVKLSYTAYILLACAEAMKEVPAINSRWHADSVEVFSDINIGVGTALGDKGLVVPVIKGVQEKSLLEVAKELQDVTSRARDNKLRPADMRSGTFTISNHGVSGSLIATPIIINQPQSAILGVGKLEKRAVVRSLDGQDVMLIKPMAYVSLTIDHRVIDGHQTNTWLAAFVAHLQSWK